MQIVIHGSFSRVEVDVLEKKGWRKLKIGCRLGKEFETLRDAVLDVESALGVDCIGGVHVYEESEFGPHKNVDFAIPRIGSGSKAANWMDDDLMWDNNTGLGLLSIVYPGTPANTRAAYAALYKGKYK